MTRPVTLALLALAACSSKNAVPPKPSALVGTWKPWLSPVGDGLVYDVFDDASGIWRCTDTTCVHFGPGGGETARFELPCNTASRAVSPSATLYAVSCSRSNTEYDVFVIDLKTLARREFKMTIGFRIAVDDAGVVTATSFPVREIARASAQSAERRVAIQPPTQERDMVLGVETSPASAPWLGFTFGAAPSDLAWREDGTSVALGGELVAELGDGLLARTPQDRYVVVAANGSRPLAEGSPPALDGPTDLRRAEGPWGRDGFFVRYGKVAQLRGRDGRVVHTVPVLDDTDGVFSSDATGTRLELRYTDGHVMIWDPPLQR